MLKLGQFISGVVALASLLLSAAGPDFSHHLPAPGAVVLFAAAAAIVLRHRELRAA